MKKTKNSFFVFLMIVFLSGCQSTENTEISSIRPVRTQVVAMNEGGQIRSFSGLAKSGSTTPLSFQVNGRIEKISVQIGDKVNKNQIIARLDDSDYRPLVSQARSGVVLAKTKYDNAKSQYQRMLNLYETDSISRNDLDSAYTAFQVSKAALSQSREQLNIALKKHSYTKLKIEDEECVVADLLAQENQIVAPGQPVVLMECGQHLEIEVFVPETIISQIKRGLKVKVKFSSLPETYFNATVSEVGVSTTGRITFPVVLVLDEFSPQLRIGMTANVFFPVSSDNQAAGIILPFFAVGADQQGNFVYLFEPTVGKNGIARRQSVSIGPVSQQGILVIEGLEVGQQVITAGINHLQTGRKVKLMSQDLLQ